MDPDEWLRRFRAKMGLSPQIRGAWASNLESLAGRPRSGAWFTPIGDAERWAPGALLGQYDGRADFIQLDPRGHFDEEYTPDFALAHEFGHRLSSREPWTGHGRTGMKEPGRYAASPEDALAGTAEDYANDFARGVMNERVGLPISPTSFTPEVLAVLRQGGTGSPRKLLPARPLNTRLNDILARLTGR